MKKVVFFIFLVSAMLTHKAMEKQSKEVLILPPISNTTNKKLQKRAVARASSTANKYGARSFIRTRLQINGQVYEARGTAKSLSDPIILRALATMSEHELSFLNKSKFVV